MLSHWFTPLDTGLISQAAQYCNTIHEDGKDFPVIAQSELAIIGFDPDFSNGIRQILYKFENHFSSLRIADLGNLKSNDVEFALPAIKELIDGGIIPICLGAPAHIIQKLRHRLENNRPNTIYHVSNRLPEYHSDDKYEVLGFQRHLCAMDRIIELEEISHSSMSLAKLRAYPDIQEAVLRDADLVHFDGNAIKLADNPASIESNTSGLTCAEACQAMKNIGGSHKLQLLNLTNYEIIDERRQYASNLTMAEMIWYFFEGYANKLNDHPQNVHSYQRFVINSLDTDVEMVFLKNDLTGRWWFVSDAKNIIYHACAYEEYLEASNGGIPNRLLKYLA